MPKKKTPLHPELEKLMKALPPGRAAGGLLHITKPGEHQAELKQWLMGRDAGRIAIGRSAFGELLVFRDLGDREPGAHDVALVDVHTSAMKVLGYSVDDFLENIGDAKWQKAFLRRDLFLKAKKKLGDYADDEAYIFVPALRLGGAEEPKYVDRASWVVQQEILFQLATG